MPDFAVRIVQYPGREDRIAEKHPPSLNALAEAIAEALLAVVDQPLCLFGHSMGAIVAFEVARRLQAAGRGKWLRLCVSSCPAPHLVREVARTPHTVHQIPSESETVVDDEALVARVRSVAGETSAFNTPQLRDLAISVLRADFRLLEQYRTDPEPRVDVSILTVRGGDEDIDPADMDAWSEVTRGDCRSLVFPGGHFYFTAGHDAILDAVRRWCEQPDRGRCRPTESTHGGPGTSGDCVPSDDGVLRDDDIAVIGYAARVPGAADLDEFWARLCAGSESLTPFTDEQLRSAGVTAQQLADPRLVRARPILTGVADFDAEFFGYAPSEARLIDPQQRLFLECAWEAVESAGYDPQRYDGAVGVFAGNATSTYYLANLLANPAHLASVGSLQAALATEKDFLAPRVSYKLDLRGPSISLATGCSTSLVAVHLAVQSVLSGESDMALAGGAAITFPQYAGHVAAEGGTISPTGRCRAFDAAADGTLTGDGVGVVLVKRATSAVADGDSILGIIKGSAVNNDGGDKAGFAAPSVQGQADVVTEALGVAEVPAETIDYVETHGTGTPLGDPIEIAALSEAFRREGDTRTAACRLGTLKPNIGHTDAASGVLGVVKTLLAFRHHMYPPAINFTAPNPRIDFSDTPFYVGTDLRRWDVPAGKARRAGVSSFAVGGTNAHVVLQESPASKKVNPADPPDPQLLVLSARTAPALLDMRQNLARHLARHPRQDLADVAATLRLGRRVFRHRFAAVCQSSGEARAVLAGAGRMPCREGVATEKPSGVAFLFPGQGSQFSGMGERLAASSPVYRRHLDECASLFEPLLGMDMRGVLYDPGSAAADVELGQTRLTQPALFAVGYALAGLLEHWGASPIAMLGHSIGELVAACVAGVFPLETAAGLVALRGELLQQCEVGAMAAVGASLPTVIDMLPPGVTVAAVNAPEQIVATGTESGIDALADRAARLGVRCRRLAVDRGFHSALVDSAADRFTAAVAKTRPRPPRIPFVSNVTGTWITEEQATDPGYWGRQLRETVQFAAGFAELRAQYPDAVLVEAGPGHTMRGLVSVNAPGSEVVSMLGGRSGDSSVVALAAAGQLWVAGVDVDMRSFGELRQRVALPTYPFQRERMWVDAPNSTVPERSTPKNPNIAAPVGVSHLPQGIVERISRLNQEAQRDRGGLGQATQSNAVARVWCEALGVPEAGPRDNFFDLGGNSLIAARIVAALEERCRVAVSVVELWDRGATLADLTELVSRKTQEETTDEC